MGGRGSGKPPKFWDEAHMRKREWQLNYYSRNREAILLGKKLKISVGRARKLVPLVGTTEIRRMLWKRDGKQELLQKLVEIEREEEKEK